MNRSEHSSPDTCRKLMEAAGVVFTEKGFRKATVHEICRRAGANVAAVNYHFGGKKNLYRAVIRHWFSASVDTYPPTLGLRDHPTPRQQLHAYIRSFLFRLLVKEHPASFGKLMAWELIDPTGLIDKLIRESIVPLSERLFAIIQELIGPGVDAAVIGRCCASITGQCMFYRHARPMIKIINPSLAFEPRDIEILADHIYEFSLGAVLRFKRKRGKSS